MNFYKHHIGDYDADTAHLSWVEDAAYRRLISLYYRRESPIPADVPQACRLVRATTKPERDAVAAVLAEFFTLEGDGWHSKRCDAEIAEAADAVPEREAKKENNRERQRRTRERRKGLFDALRGHNIVPAYDTPTGELQRLLSQAESQPASRHVTQPVTRDATAIQTPDSRLQTPEEKPPKPPEGVGGGSASPGTVHRFPPGFEAFWSAYPRKVGKDAAAKAFAKRKPDRGLIDRMLAAIAEQRLSEAMQREGGRFVPHPATWLNEGRWLDENPAPAGDELPDFLRERGL